MEFQVTFHATVASLSDSERYTNKIGHNKYTYNVNVCNVVALHSD